MKGRKKASAAVAGINWMAMISHIVYLMILYCLVTYLFSCLTCLLIDGLASILACDFACIFDKFLAIHDCLSGSGSWKSTVFPPLRTFCNSLGVFDALAPLVLCCGWFGVVGGVKNSAPPEEFGDGGGDGCGELF